MYKKLVLAALIAGFPSVLSGQQLQRDTVITVNLTRTARVPADRASFYVGVELLAESAPAAVERLQAKLKAATDSMRRVSPTSVFEVPVVLGAGPSQTNSYPQPPVTLIVARGAVRVTVNKLSELPLLQMAATIAGATMTGGISYEATTVENVWKAKSAEAISSARSTAEASAEIQGYRLGRLLTLNVSGGPPNIGFQQQTQLNFDSRNGYQTMAATETVVNATVLATYLLVKK